MPDFLPFAPPGTLDRLDVLLAFPDLGIALDDLGPAQIDRVLALAGRVSIGSGTYYGRTLTVSDDLGDNARGPEQVRVDLYTSEDGEIRTSTLVCRPCLGADSCEHVAAVRLALAWKSPALREWIALPAWRKVLLPLAAPADPDAAPAPRAAAGPTHDGWIRYTLRSPGETALAEVTGRGPRSPLDAVLDREIVKCARKSGQPGAPNRFPSKFSDAEARVPVTDVDREIDRYFEELRSLVRLADKTWRPVDARTSRLVDDLTGRALGLLAGVRELRFEGEPIAASAEPLLPHLEASDGPDATIALRWRPAVRAVYAAGPGYVVTAEGVLRPLHRGLPPAALPLLDRWLPPVPVADAGDFLREVVLRTAVPIDLAAHNVPHLRGAPVAPRPRLRIGEAGGGALTVEAAFVYADADHTREVAAGDPSALVVLGDVGGTPRLTERDTVAEERALALLAEFAPAPYPARLEGDAALGLLFELATDGTSLRSAWEVLFDPRLAGVRSAGRFAPKVAVESGIDWFEIHVDFAGQARAKAPLGALIEAWRAGRRFVRLSNGAIGRIPSEWLARHGEAVLQLEEVQSAGGGKLRAFAAPLAAELLGEAGLPAAAERWRHIGERIRAFERVPDWPLPPGLTATLRDYQVRGFHWLVWLRDLDLGGVLADDMGLGKTLQVLALLLDTHADAEGPPSLVVAPTSVVHGWVAEAARFTPELRVVLHHGGGRGAALPGPGEADVIVTSYALLRQDEALFRAAAFRYAVLDEAQAIKNPASQIAQLCHALPAEHRLAVTGTPLENNLVELWSLFQFLMPGFFGGRTAFNGRYATPIQKYRDDEAMAALRGRIRPFVLRRRKDEVARELPPRTEQILYCELDPTQRRLYESVKDTYRDQVFHKVDELGLGRATIQVLEALTRLRQACCDPRLLPFDEARLVTTSAKRSLLTDTLDEILAEGHRTLIFSQWPSLLRLVEADLQAAHIGYLYLDGATTDRKTLVERWNDPDGPPVFLISLKAGGTGLNLTGADHVIHLDPWWNPAVEAQATDRAHRIGQTRPVMVYKLVARDTVEEKILELQARKRALFDAAVDADRMLVDTLTRADLETVFAPAAPAPPRR